MHFLFFRLYIFSIFDYLVSVIVSFRSFDPWLGAFRSGPSSHHVRHAPRLRFSRDRTRFVSLNLVHLRSRSFRSRSALSFLFRLFCYVHRFWQYKSSQSNSLLVTSQHSLLSSSGDKPAQSSVIYITFRICCGQWEGAMTVASKKVRSPKEAEHS